MKKEQSNQIKLISVERVTSFNFIETCITFKSNGFLGEYTTLEDVDTHTVSHIIRYSDYTFIDSKLGKVTVIADMSDYNTIHFIKSFNNYFEYKLPN